VRDGTKPPLVRCKISGLTPVSQGIAFNSADIIDWLGGAVLQYVRFEATDDPWSHNNRSMERRRFRRR
jgi:hypothetical protein